MNGKGLNMAKEHRKIFAGVNPSLEFTLETRFLTLTVLSATIQKKHQPR